MSEPLHVLVVCTANICRSPAAATLLRYRIGARDDVVVTSAGVAALDGSAACEVASTSVAAVVAARAAAGTAPSPGDPVHASRPVTEALLAQADLVLALDRSHRGRLAQLSPRSRAKTFTLRQAARLAAAVGLSVAGGEVPPGAPPLPADQGERLHWFVSELDAIRGSGMPADAGPHDPVVDPDDVPDPHVLGFQLHPLALGLIDESVDTLATAIEHVLDASLPGAAERNPSPPSTPETDAGHGSSRAWSAENGALN